MDHKQLHEELERLNREIDRTQPSDEEQRQRLKALRDSVQAALDRDHQENPHPYASLSDLLRESIQQFELTHPNLTLAMDRMLDILSQSGI